MFRSLEKSFERYRRHADVAALGEVFDQVAPELMALACRLTRSVDEAEDLVQATFVAAIESAERWDPSRRLVPWLTGILGNQWRMQRRRTERESRRSMPVKPPLEPSETAMRGELRRRVGRAVASLPRRYREVVRLSLEEGLSSSEIGRLLGRDASTVRTQLSRGLELLRQRLPAGLAGALTAMTGVRGLAAVRHEVALHAGSNSALSIAPLKAALTGGKLMLIALILGVAGLLPLLLSGPGSDPEPRGSAVVAEGSPASGSSGAAGGGASASAGTAPSLRSAIPGTRKAVSLPLKGSEVLLRILDENGDPVPGAELRALSPQAPDVVRRWGRGRATLGELLDEAGEVWVSDEQGLVRLPTSAPRMADVRTGSRRAFVHWTEESEFPLDITLPPTATLPVRVTTPLGTPEGVEIRLYQTAFGSFVPTTLLHRAIADESGSADIEGIDRLTMDQYRRQPHLAVGAAFPLSEQTLMQLDPGDPARPIVLELPALGALDIVVIDPEGRPVRDLLSIGVARRDRPAEAFWGTTRNGTRSLPHLGLGLELQIQVVSETGSWPDHELLCTGPQQAGARVRVEVPLSRDGRTIQGRALVAEDRPVDGPLFARVMNSPVPRSLVPVMKGDGFFELFVPTGLEVVLSARQDDRDWTLVAPLAAFEADGAPSEVVLGSPPVLLTGRCVDEDGRGLAQVELQAIERSRRSGRPWTSTTTAAGDFEIRGWCATEELELSAVAWQAKGQRDRLDCRVGDSGLLLTLGTRQDTLRVRGHLPLRGGLPRLQVGFERAGLFHTGQLGVDGRFEVRVPESGVYDFVVRLPGFRESLCRVSEVVIDGSLCADPRIEELEVETLLRRIELKVVDGEGRPIDLAALSVQGGPPRSGVAVLWKGQGKVWVPVATRDLVVHAKGFRDVEIKSDAVDGPVALDDAIELPIRLSTPLDLEDSESLEVRVVPEGEGAGVPFFPLSNMGGGGFGSASDVRRRLEPSFPVDLLGEALGFAADVGPHRLTLHLVRKVGRRRSSTQLGDAATALVVDGRNELVVLSVSQAELEAARDSLD